MYFVKYFKSKQGKEKKENRKCAEFTLDESITGQRSLYFSILTITNFIGFNKIQILGRITND